VIAVFVLAATGSAAAQDSMNGSRIQRPQLSVSYTVNAAGDADAIAEIRNGFGPAFALTVALVENGLERRRTTTLVGTRGSIGTGTAG
jgi:hypothetical protein